MEEPDALPDVPRFGGRGQMLESLASMTWTLTFLGYSSSTILSEFGVGVPALWTILLIALPPVLASLHEILRGDRAMMHALARYIVYIVVPAVLQIARPDDRLPDQRKTAALLDALTFAAVWLPLELNLLPKIGPTGKVTIWPTLTGALSALNTFSVLRPLEMSARPIGYSFKLTPGDVFLSLLVAVLTSAILYPIAVGFGLGSFVRPRGLKGNTQVAVFVGLYFVALLEEIVFRGIALNMLDKYVTNVSRAVPLLLSSLLYGLAHLKHDSGGRAYADWRRAIVATITGIFCSLVWRRSGKVTVSAVTHAVVEYLMKTFLVKPAAA